MLSPFLNLTPPPSLFSFPFLFPFSLLPPPFSLSLSRHLGYVLYLQGFERRVGMPRNGSFVTHSASYQKCLSNPKVLTYPFSSGGGEGIKISCYNFNNNYVPIYFSFSLNKSYIVCGRQNNGCPKMYTASFSEPVTHTCQRKRGAQTSLHSVLQTSS